MAEVERGLPNLAVHPELSCSWFYPELPYSQVHPEPTNSEVHPERMNSTAVESYPKNFVLMVQILLRRRRDRTWAFHFPFQ